MCLIYLLGIGRMCGFEEKEERRLGLPGICETRGANIGGALNRGSVKRCGLQGGGRNGRPMETPGLLTPCCASGVRTGQFTAIALP
jgi:hypothetical protein